MQFQELQELRAVARTEPSYPQVPDRVLRIMQEEASRAGTTVNALRGPRRDRRHAWARQAAYYRLRQMVTAHGVAFSLPQLGRWFGGRDHTTVLFALNRYSVRMGLELPKPISLPPIMDDGDEDTRL